MFPYTNSYLEMSAANQTANNTNTAPPPFLLNRFENMGENDDGFILESITEKIEPLDIDDILKEDQLFQEFQQQSIHVPTRLDPKLQEYTAKPIRHQSAKQKDKPPIIHNTKANKMEKQTKSLEEDANERWGQITEQKNEKETEMMEVNLKIAQMQKRAEFLKRENKELWAKQKSMRIKIQQQCEDSFKYEIQGLQAELLFEKEKSDTERNDLQRKIRDYERQIKKLEVRTKKEEESQHNDSDLKAKNEEIRKLKVDAEAFHTQKSRLLNEITALNAINEEHKNTIRKNQQKKVKVEANSHQSTRVKLQGQLKAQLSKVVKLQSENQSLKRNITDSQMKLKQLKAAKQKLELQLRKVTGLKELADAQGKKNAKQYEQLMKNYERADSDRKQLTNKRSKLQKQLETKNASIETFKKKFQEDIQSLKAVQREMKQKEMQVQQLKKQRQQIADQMDRLQTELDDCKSENSELHHFKKIVKNEFSDLSRWMRLPPPTANINKEYFMELGKWMISLKYFSDSLILRGLKMEKREFLVDALREFLYCHSFDTQLLYRFDPLNPTNFHNYIDNHDNLLIVLELANGTVLAGFSAFPIDPQRTERPGKGLLMSITDEKVYHVREDPKLPVMPFDSYYYILGNAEIRLKSQEKKIFSNFGIANSTFDNGKDLRADFLKVRESTNNELEINSYEFYQLRAGQ